MEGILPPLNVLLKQEQKCAATLLPGAACGMSARAARLIFGRRAKRCAIEKS